MAAKPGDLLVVVHEFQARSPDELKLTRGDRIELIERDDDFGDGWFLGRNTETGQSGLFPEVYTRPAPTATSNLHQRAPSQPVTPARGLEPKPADHAEPPHSAPLPLYSPFAPDSSSEPSPSIASAPSPALLATAQAGTASRSSIPPNTRSISQTLSGEPVAEEEPIASPVMHETLSVIDEHITDMSTPRHSQGSKDVRAANDSGSEYSSHHRLSYANGQESEEEEQDGHTEKQVMAWSPTQVAAYLEENGVAKAHCKIFEEQEINGEALLGMDQATIFLKEFELGPVGPRLRTWVKVKALQQEVKAAKDAPKMPKQITPLESQHDPNMDPNRNRATSMGAVLPRIPSLRESPAAKGRAGSQPLPRANSTATAGFAPSPVVEVTTPLSQFSPVSPVSPIPNHVSRPSAASIRSLNHNRRHSSIDSTRNAAPVPPTAGGAAAKAPPIASSAAAHKKTPSFDRGWTMGVPQQDTRPATSGQLLAPGFDGNAPSVKDDGVSSVAGSDVDRGYFSGGELDNRKARNVLRKKDGHERNASYASESGSRMFQSRRHSRIGSTESTVGTGHPISPAARAYYGSSIAGQSSTTNVDYVRPLKAMHDSSPSIGKLDFGAGPSIDAVAASPKVVNSEPSSAAPSSHSPAGLSHSHSFFGKKSRVTGLRAISDAITGHERASAGAGDSTASTAQDSPLQSPSRTGSSTPSGETKSFDIDSPDAVKRLTNGSVPTKDAARRRSKKHTTSAYLRGRETITPQEAMASCDYSGWMKKKSSSLMTTWKTRLFVLRGRRLSYFYTENDTEEKGLIDISSHRVLPANNERITGLHAALTRAASSPTSPSGATITTTAATDSLKSTEDDVSGMFIFKLVPPRAGMQRGVQFTKPIVHYFAVDNVHVGRLWMAALMKATIDRDDSLTISTTYQQKTISLEKAQAMRQRPPALMDDYETEGASLDVDSKAASLKGSSVQGSTIHEEVEPQAHDRDAVVKPPSSGGLSHGLAISGLDDAKALLDYADNGGSEPRPETADTKAEGVLGKENEKERPSEVETETDKIVGKEATADAEPTSTPAAEHKKKPSFTPGLVSPVG